LGRRPWGWVPTNYRHHHARCEKVGLVIRACEMKAMNNLEESLFYIADRNGLYQIELCICTYALRFHLSPSCHVLLLLQRTISFSYGITGYGATTRTKIQTGSNPIPKNKTSNRPAMEPVLFEKVKTTHYSKNSASFMQFKG